MKKVILAKNDTFWLPNAKQKKLAQLLADPTDDRTNQEKANGAGVALRTFYRYIANPVFVEYVNSLVPQETDREIASIWRSLCAEARKGNVQAIKLFLEAKGYLMPKSEVKTLVYNPLNQLSNEELLEKMKELEQKIIESYKIRKQLEDQSKGYAGLV